MVETKIKVKIESYGLFNAFGYRSLRTPAIIEIYEHQLILLKVMEISYKLLGNSIHEEI